MISSSSEESIRFRFRSVFRQPTHAMAILHCMIDHERQISIVAETGTGGNKELVGIAQLIADANHDTAEFAVLVPDPWQGKRIGGMLLDYSIELARTWGIRSIEAETDPFNQRMLTSFRKRGFSTYTFMEDKITMAKLNLEQEVINEHSDN
jgi:acetyltransferase